MISTTLKKRTEFVRVAQIRNVARLDTIWVQCYSDPKLNACRVGYTASKKVGNAVKRNRAKRRLREVYKQCNQRVLANYPQFKGDFVLIAVPSTVVCSFSELLADYKNATEKCLNRLYRQPKTRN